MSSIFKPVGSNTYYPSYSKLGLIEFTNPTFGQDLRQNPGFSGTPDNIHNGTDNAYWTATNLVGTNWIFNSTTQAHTGTRSIDGSNTIGGDVMLLSRASTISTSSYSTLSGWIYITSWSNPENNTRNINLKLRNNGTEIGQTVGILAQIEPTRLNEWQQFTVQMSSFTIQTVDFNEITFTIQDEGAGPPPDFFLDDLAWQESGGSVIFKAAVPQGFSIRLEQFSITFARTTTETTPVWNTILGKTFTNGIVLQAWTPFGAANLGVFRRHVDWMFPPGLRTFYSHDGTVGTVTYEFDFTTPLTLSGDLNGEFRCMLQDDLSDFLFAQCGARGEIVPSTQIDL